MNKDWFIRLKKARLNKNLTLAEVSERIPSKLTQQSLIKYEKGFIYPKIDILIELCILYNVTIDYILFGDESSVHFNIPEENVLITLFFLMYKKELLFKNNDKTLLVKEDRLRSKLYKLSIYIENKNISTIEDLHILIDAIKKISKE